MSVLVKPNPAKQLASQAALEANATAGTTAPHLGVIILAGGRAKRLGGISKPDLEWRGRRLLDHILADLEPTWPCVVVAPETVEVPAQVIRVLEDPPLGGPVAGIAAGFAALTQAATVDLVAILSCDAPRAARAVPALAAAIAQEDGAIAHCRGYRQNLLCVLRTESLRARLLELAETRDLSVKRLYAPLSLRIVPVKTRICFDIDSWEDLQRFQEKDFETCSG